MWCLCSHIMIPKHATPFYKALIPSVSATSEPRRRRPDVSTNQQVGELGHTLLATLQPNPNPIPKQRKQEGEEAQISGSDVLWALQRASACKKKKKKQEHGRGLSSVASRMEQSAVDYSNVRPLCIKAHWTAKLDELEKCLRELSDTI